MIRLSLNFLCFIRMAHALTPTVCTKGVLHAMMVVVC